ncbi:MAG: FAD-dependent oxidoreductase [Candidatus Lokiarchaeota archaeon]|nr:FAD-dependent oxidoreductase [Candidatus Lokiarchaeota archaeon]
MIESLDLNKSKKAIEPISAEFNKKLIESVNYCYSCNRCNTACPTAYLGTFFPRNLITDITFLSIEETLENNNIWKCLSCGACVEYCPMSKENSGVNFLDLILNLRSLVSTNEALQLDKNECQHNREYANLPRMMANEEIEISNRLGFLSDTNLKISDEGEIGYFMGCMPLMSSIPPCTNACPAGVDVQGYVGLIKEGKFQEALDLIRERNPFPVVCGRVCTHPCERNCNREEIDDPIAIRALKRFVSDWEIQNKGLSKFEPAKPLKEKVAIIGAGPAGLSAAFYLALKGYKPTVFEESSYTGGKLRSGIPEYRLPQDTLDYEIEFIEKMGVEIKTNTPIGPDLTFDDLREQGYKAIYIGIGLGESRNMGVEGEDLDNILYGLDFLEKVNVLNEKYDFKNKVIGVVGGGNVAIDSARTALRLGAKKVMVIYRRSQNEMPALKEEVEDAISEGVEFQFLTNPIHLVRGDTGSCEEAECIQMELGEPDASGRRSPVEIEGSEFKIKIDLIILAIGQVANFDLIKAAESRLEFDKRGRIKYNDLTLETNLTGVFAGGDILAQKGIAINAISNGYEAAISIDRYLNGQDLKERRVNRTEFKKSPIPKKKINEKSRNDMGELDTTNRIKTFNEVEVGLTEEIAIKEANRCLNCSSCSSLDQMINEPTGKLDYGKHHVMSYYNTVDYLKIPRTVIGLLNHKEIIPVVLKDEKCCGHDSLWQGDIETFERLAKHNVKIFKEAGVKTLIFSCAEGYYTWKHKYSELFDGDDGFDFDIYHITDFILKENLLEGLKFPITDKIKVTYHDACRLGRLSKVFDEPRIILKDIPFIEVVEMKSNKEDALCCGVNAYISCDEYSKTIQRNRILEAIETGASYLLVSCPKCLAHFNCYLEEHPDMKEKIKAVEFTSFLGNLLFLT